LHASPANNRKKNRLVLTLQAMTIKDVELALSLEQELGATSSESQSGSYR
jgi:hypothetical protein